jgi:hypothetical protein
MVLPLMAWILPALLALIAVPMVLEKVPPNWIYGFRTPKTLSSPDIWYPANRAAGWYMIAASALAMLLNLAVWWMHPDWDVGTLVGWMGGFLAFSVLLAAGASFWYLRKL